jgi:hypothetical protein
LPQTDDASESISLSQQVFIIRKTALTINGGKTKEVQFLM